MFCRRLQCALFVAFVAIPGVLFAQPPGRGGPQTGPSGGMRGGPPADLIFQIFQQADANNDGVVTRVELMTAMQNQSRGTRFGRGGPPPQANQMFGNPRPQGPPPGAAEDEQLARHPGPPPQPGQVLPETVTESLSLDARQKRRLAALQEDVDKRLAAILTDEQQEQLNNFRPPQGPGPGEPPRGERGAGELGFGEPGFGEPGLGE